MDEEEDEEEKVVDVVGLAEGVRGCGVDFRLTRRRRMDGREDEIAAVVFFRILTRLTVLVELVRLTVLVELVRLTVLVERVRLTVLVERARLTALVERVRFVGF